jgi:hypothetical protein
MKKQIYIFIVAVVVFAFVVVWFEKSKTYAPEEQPVLKEVTNSKIAISTYASQTIEPPVIAPTNSPVNQFDRSADIEKEYRQGIKGKEQAIQEIYLERNKRPQDFYGKVIDQYGQPIAGTKVTGILIFNTEVFGGVRTETYNTQADAEGLFQFTGLRGESFRATVKKDGYKMGEHGEGYQSPAGGRSSPNNRVILTMWKIRGAEPMKHLRFESSIPYDGTAAIFNLQNGKKTQDGDLRITLLRSPLQIRPGLLHPYDWQVRIELINGGGVEQNDPYPYWAPENGYQPFFETGMSSNNIPWNEEFRQNFYTKNAQGQYGRLFIDVSTSSKRPETGITIEAWINPSGSQNLEFDPAKQVQ